MSQAAQLCTESALAHNAQQAIAYRWEEFKLTTTYRNNYRLFSQPKGLGYWSWKPWCIREGMIGCADGDILIYIDAGVKVINNLNYIVDRMDQDVWLFGNEWEHYQWCKRDVVEVIMGPEAFLKWPWERFSKQAQASVIFFKVNDYTYNFVSEWFDWCRFDNGRLVDDSPSSTPNHPDFREHRYDQAILTTMAYRDGIKLHEWRVRYETFTPGPTAGYSNEDRSYPPVFLHHRIRNDEWANHSL
jgi:hypothetical protein